MTDSSRLQGSNQSLLYLFMSYDVFKKHRLSILDLMILDFRLGNQ